MKIVVFRGRETRGGHAVLLHQLTEPNDHTGVLMRALQYLVKNPTSAGGRILDLVEIQRAHFLVTVDQPECLALREWLDWEMDGPKPPPSLAPSPAATHEPGEFTQLFQKPSGNRASAEDRPIAQPAGPGEFTQLFEREGHGQPPQPGAPSMPMAPAQVASENQPGEFTRLFRSPLAAPSDGSRQPLPVGSPSQNTPGEFTRIFGGGGTPVSTSSSPAATPPPAPPPTPVSPVYLTESLEQRQTLSSASVAPGAPGEFTRVIGRPSGGPPATPPPAPQPAAPAPSAMPMPTMPAASPAPMLPPSFSQPAATHPTMPAAPQMPSVSFPASAPAPAPPSGARPPLLPIIILFGVLLLAAFALVLFVILRR